MTDHKSVITSSQTIFFFFFNDTATTEIYTLSLHDALPIAFVALSEGSADPTGPKALRASMGALFRVPLITFDEAPGRRVALVAHGGTSLTDLDLSGQTTFVLGAEREGLPAQVLGTCEERA